MGIFPGAGCVSGDRDGLFSVDAPGTLSYFSDNPDGSHDCHGAGPHHYMGFGIAPKILTVVLMCFFPVAVSFCDGLAQVEEEYVNLVRSYGAGRWKSYGLVKIPAAIPALISGLKVAATYSISGAVVGEWIGAQKGLGYYLLRVKNSYMLDRVFACVAVIIFLSLCMNGVIRLYQYKALPYMRKQ